MSIKLRKAATCLVKEIEDGKLFEGLGVFKRDIGNFILGGIKNALAEPVLNCEVGTAEEQRMRHYKWCRKHGLDGDNKANCRHSDMSCSLCVLRWAQMPYEEVK